MTKLLERNKRKETSCPVCKAKVTKRSLQESPGFQKLVEGLQTLVRSYEFDTRTNYFTGLPQRRQGASVETESRDQQGSGENTTSEGDVTEKEATLSSTAAAKDAFAKLMCFEDSCAATSEQDCLDSGPGDVPQKSGINPADPEDVPPRAEASDSQTQQDVTPEDGKHSRRRSKRLCLEPDRIMDKRQKKSVQKVSEWLLKISPTSDTRTESNAEGDLPVFADSDAEKESTASRASTEINASAEDKADASPEREVPCRGLEEQVFGAVYKRERKVLKTTKVTKSFSPERQVAPVDRSGNLSEKDEKIKMPMRRSSRKLTPADFIRKTSNEDKEDGVNQEEVDGGSKEGNSSKPLRFSDEQEKVVQSGPDDENAENTEESPAFEVPLKKPGRRSKMQEVWQDVDRDLTEKENNTDNKKDRKRRITRSSRDTTKSDDLEKCKNAKYSKSLALVSAGTEIVDLRENVPNNPKLIEAEVNIESYPSSAEPKSPDARKTRRSSRLQEFTAEVQGLPRRRRSKQALPKPADEPEHNTSTNLDEPRPVKTDHVGTGEPSQRERPERPVRRNGCVYNDDFENIEIVQSGEDAASAKCVSEGTVTEENSLVSVVPDTGGQDEHVTPRSTKAANSTSPLAALVPESFPQKRQESPPSKTLTPAVEQRDTDQGEDTNDSELDTEQLLKTFKATKRKSFYLGSPRTSHSRTQEKSLTQILEEDKQESVDQAEIPGISPDTDQVLPSDPCELAPHEIMPPTSQSCVASVSLLQVKSPAPPSLPKDSQKDDSIKISGASDHPEKVAKSQDSRTPVNVEFANSIQLFSTTVTQEEPQISLSEDSTKSPKSSEIQGKQLQANTDVDLNTISSIPLGNMTDSETRCNNFESSVTPDGLVTNGPEALVMEPATTQNLDKMDEGEILSQPSLRRKRKAQRLESTDSESSLEDDNLPPLAQIFKSHHLSSPSAKDPEINSLNQDGLQAEEQSPKPGLDPVSQDSCSRSDPEAQSSPASQCVAPYQKPQDVPEDENSNNVQDGGVPDPPGRDEWITSSQGSVDLFGTPRESEEVVDGVCGNTGLSIESSQYSSEIVTTQQREEMQQELHRLEKMMALVSEALQKKDGDLDEKNKTEDDDQRSGTNRQILKRQ
ncbi:hypothetical protein PDJAM_G00031530 [Pangasius djambal]|uniref:Uncharacterized protein n=1 Tax=Pangasius djambal TaxID=1691987 RepID=A0ACC5YRI5_9TELE|nr:hypothetical protein [Pangasius djambal]